MAAARLYEQVVVPVDGSPRALEALPVARRLAERFDAGLWLVTVDDGSADPEANLATGRSHIDGNVRTTVLAGEDPAPVLGAFDDEHPDALLCLTTRGRRPLVRTVLGSVATEVVRHSSQALVLVGSSCGSGETHAVDRLLVCLDGSPQAEVALDWAERWSAATSMRLSLFNATYPLPDPAARVAPAQSQLDDLAYLPRLVRRLEAEGHDVELVGGPHADPAAAIVGVASDRPGCLVAMASRDRPPLGQVVLGSVVAEVLRTSPAPLLLASR